MIVTELIVIITFLSRFSLDRKLTDLKEEIGQKQTILEVNLPLETEIRAIQSQLSDIKALQKFQTKPLDTLVLMQRLVPIGVQLESLSITQQKVNANVIASSNENFSAFLSNLNAASKQLGFVEVGNVNKQASTGIQFSLSSQLPK